MNTKTITILPPHNLQEEIENDSHRFRVVACGRRWGKTLMAMREAFNMLVKGFDVTRRRQRCWVVSPTFPLVKEDWLIAEELLKDAITSKHQTDMKMVFEPFGFIEFKSAERDDEGLRGAGLDCAVVDEASRVSRKSWEQGLRPALADKQGRCIFISTPKGRNWFYELYQKGQNNDQEIKSWKYPTRTNPFFPQVEWDTIERTTPEIILRQEYNADFLEDEASVFKNISRCLRGRLEEPVSNEYYTIGIDLGKTEDFTVVTVIKNSNCQVVQCYRENKIDWSIQKELIRSICGRYKNNVVYIDSTGLGNPIADDLRRFGINIIDYKFTNASKEILVEALIVAIEQGLVGIPECSKTQFLIDELKDFSYEILPSGKIRYSAPDGMHDDGVISLGLAVKGISHLLYNKPREPEKIITEITADMEDKAYNKIKRMGGVYGYDMGKHKFANRVFRRQLVGLH